MKTLAVTGTGGRVGRALAERLAGRHRVISLARPQWELASEGIAEQIEALDFDVLLHPAAMTSLEACEDNPELAWRVNAEVPGELAAACARRGRRMVHFSTDYVLRGDEPGLHGEDAEVVPQSVYGRTKAESETRVLGAGGCVMRVSWVFGREKPSFPDQVMAKALNGEPLAGVADKTSLPCWTRDLAEWVHEVVEIGCPARLYHACQSGEPVSWHDLATAVVGHLVARGRLERVPEVAVQRLEEMTAFRAPRPRHTAMATDRLAELLGGIPPRPWREALGAFLDERLEDGKAG